MSKKNNLLKFPNLITNIAIANLSKEVNDLKTNNKQICEKAVKSILKALDLKDHYTFGHSTRVAYLSLVVGKELGLNKQELYDLELTALFHDIGKIGVTDAVLLKPSRLDEDEFIEMKSHPEKSFEILAEFDEFVDVAFFAKHHHERVDGRGYPSGLKGDEIPLFSRIIFIADTFDAMTSSRTYRKALPYQVAYDELVEFSGSQFDENLVKHFITGMKKEEEAGVLDFSLELISGKFLKQAA